jgi:hypothetical protein
MNKTGKHFSAIRSFILILLFSLCSFTGDENVNDLEIIPFVGIGNIVLGKSKLNDVEKTFGKGIRYSYWEAGLFIDPIKQKMHIINYPSLGLKFVETRPLWLKKLSIQELYITRSCKCKTKMGNGIGSTLNDIRREFGAIRVMGIGQVGNLYLEVSIEGPNWDSSMEFNCYSTQDTAHFKVEEIVIFSTD